MLIGVEPALQGQGVGGKLLQPVLARADASGLACYLETATLRDVQFYTRHGFQVVEEGDVPGADEHYWTMRRARPPAVSPGPAARSTARAACSSTAG